jgi:hypothetical protein
VAQRKTARKSSPKRQNRTKAAGRSTKTAVRSATAKRCGGGRTKAKTQSPAEPAVGDREVTIDRRRSHLRPAEGETRTEVNSCPPIKLERRKKVNRRRQIDPTTCERDYTEDEIEFMNAIDDYKRQSGRMFPTCSEVLEVVRGLGYVKLSLVQAAGVPQSYTPHVSERIASEPAESCEPSAPAAN